MIKKLKKNKPLVITYRIIKAIISVFLVMALIVILVQKFTNNNLSIGGIRVFTVVSESMKPEYEVGDIILIKEVAPSELKVGDNVTYLGEKLEMAGLVVTHQIISIRKDGDNYYYTTKGTSNEAADPEISYSQIYGKVVYKTVIFGYISKAMLNVYIYYGLFTVIGLIASYQVVKIVHGDDEEEDDECKKEENKDNSKES